jgi:hypothetical protein
MVFIATWSMCRENAGMAVDRDSDIFPRVLCTLLLLGGAAAVVGVYRSDGAAPVATVESSQVQAPVAAQSSSIATPSTPVPAEVTHHVWGCEHGGQKIYSDQRCGETSSLREVDEPNRMPAEPGRVDGQNRDAEGGDRANAVRNYSDGSASPFDPNQDSAECAHLRADVNAIHERMRHPYISAEGDYYRARLRDISARQYELNCVR